MTKRNARGIIRLSSRNKRPVDWFVSVSEANATERQTDIMAETRNYTIRLDEDLRKKLEEEAKADNRTLANLITLILQKHVAKKEKK